MRDLRGIPAHAATRTLFAPAVIGGFLRSRNRRRFFQRLFRARAGGVRDSRREANDDIFMCGNLKRMH